VGAAALLQDEPVQDRLLLAALGLGELAVIAMSDRDAPVEDGRVPEPPQRLSHR
jgi:hypothetical protein